MDSQIEVRRPVSEHHLITAVDKSVTVHVLVFEITGLGVAVDDSDAVFVSGNSPVSAAHDVVFIDES